MNMIKALRQGKDLSQLELAKILSVHQTAISQWETGKTNPDMDIAIMLAKYFEVTIDYLLGVSNNSIPTSSKAIQVPVLGTIPAGIPIEAVEEILDYEEIPQDWARGGREYFALKLKGDSMYPKYLDSDIVIFEKASTCDNGQDCAVIVNGDDATFKTVRRGTEGIILQPINSEYDPKHYTNKQIDELPVLILGVAREIRRKA